jgi:hypothetical protein
MCRMMGQHHHMSPSAGQQQAQMQQEDLGCVQAGYTTAEKLQQLLHRVFMCQWLPAYTCSITYITTIPPTKQHVVSLGGPAMPASGFGTKPFDASHT